MVIIIAIYAVVVWLVFFKFKLIPWNTLSKVLVSLVGLAILLTFMGLLNSRTPSGRIAVMSPVLEVAPVVSGIVTEVPVQSHQRVKKGDILFALDKRPFEYAVQQAEANQKIANITYQRLLAAVKRSPAAASRQSIDEAHASAKAATAALSTAQYRLDRSKVTALNDGIIGAMQLQVGEKVAAYTAVMPLIGTGKARIWGVFNQNGRRAINVGSNVGIALRSDPGVVHWTTIIEIAPGIAGGEGTARADLPGERDIGDSDEILVVLAWPDGLSQEIEGLGAVGEATVIGPEAGPIGSLARILLTVKAWAQYL